VTPTNALGGVTWGACLLWHDSCIHNTFIIHTSEVTATNAVGGVTWGVCLWWHDSCIPKTCLIRSFISITWHIQLLGVSLEGCVYLTWLIHMYDMTHSFISMPRRILLVWVSHQRVFYRDMSHCRKTCSTVGGVTWGVVSHQRVSMSHGVTSEVFYESLSHDLFSCWGRCVFSVFHIRGFPIVTWVIVARLIQLLGVSL